MSQPIIKVRNGCLDVCVFESTVDGQYGSRTEYQFSVCKSIKNKQTGDWDRQRIPLFENQALELAELLSIAHRQLVSHKNTPNEEPAQDISSIDDDIKF